MQAKTIRFVRRGQIASLDNVPPDRTLLEVLREDLGCTGTKEGCGEGDCGACTVVVAELAADSPNEVAGIRYRAINSCIRLAHSIDGLALWTVEDLVDDDGAFHPAQEAMVRCHGSQCGFCTPGFVMSLFGMYQNHVCRGQAITRALAQEELSGNLCRCTGYRPILDAAQQIGELPKQCVDERALLRQLGDLAAIRAQPQDSAYLLPTSLPSLLTARAAHPNAQIVAGCTDAGLWVTKMHMQFDQILDVTRVAELRRIEHYDNHIAIGAAVPLVDAFDALIAERPRLKIFANRFAGLPIRNSATLGGNVANGSPIGDSMPLLIALNAHVVLQSVRGHREMPLEAFYTGYRKNVLAADEVLAWIKVPRPSPHPRPPPKGEGASRAPISSSPSPSGGGLGWGQEFLRAYKISKRFDDDISAVCLVLNMQFDQGAVARVSIGAGGVAATPARAIQCESFLLGKPWTEATVREAAKILRAEFQPIGDMRASAAYRSEVLGNLLQRYWLESQGAQQINLESPSWAVMPGHDPASIAGHTSGAWIAARGRNDNAGGAA
jgi:xanthine dehydrogenase small subunit